MEPSPAAGSFRIDRERAPEAIRDLEWALTELEDIRRDAELLADVDPGSRDSVSIDAARRIGRAAAGGPGSLAWALDSGILQIKELISSMRQELQGYDVAEGRASADFRQVDRA